MGTQANGMGIRVLTVAFVCGLLPAVLAGQAQSGRGATPPPAPPAAATPQAEPDYVIGIGDVLAIGVWNEASVSGDVVVRPDGKISVNLINEIEAAGLTASQLRARLTEEFMKFFKSPPTVMLQIKQINSRNVFIQGQVGKPGPYPLTQPLTISMLLAIAGGPTEYADKDKIRIIRHSERGRDGGPVSFMFNYKDFERGKNLKQDIALKPGDVVIVPGG
jgi:polysaccharide export outer membrane protein